jgi:beta-lactamase regulating signal transducer with metallopeptidase domain
VHALLNWLTQGFVIGLTAAATIRLLPRARTQTRHTFLWTAYLSLLALPAVAPLLAMTRDAAGIDTGSAVAAPLVSVPVVWWTSTTVMAALWAIWFGVHVVALGRDLVGAQAAKRHGYACARELLGRLPHWSRVSATGRPTYVMISKSVHAAGVLATGRPVIAIAPRLVAELGTADLDRVLVHEWAHVQRRDDIAHVAQRLLRAMVGWHPAAWWLERQLEFEREVACDEIAVRVTGSAKRYAECLLTIAALTRQPQHTLPVLAAVSRSRLHHRVERIVAPRVDVARPWRALAASSGLGLVAWTLAVGNVYVVASAGTSAVAHHLAPASMGAPEVAARAARASLASTAPVSNQGQASKRRPQADTRLVLRHTVAPEHAAKPYGRLPVPWVRESLLATLVEPVPGPPSGPVEHGVAQAHPMAAQDAPGDASGGWSRAADVGITIGRASQTAGVATAGFFRRFGKKIAGSF